MITKRLYQKAINPRLRGLGESATLAMQDRCRKLEQQGKKIYNLGLGQSPFPVPAPLVEALALNAKEKDYLPAKGLPLLREAVADFHRRKDGISASPENVMIGPGSKPLLFLLQLAFDGEILIPTPSWVSYAPQAKILGRNIRFIHTAFKERWRVRPQELSHALRKWVWRKGPRLLILNYPGNPDGLTYSENELAELAKTACGHNIIILSDEIYARIHHQGIHTSIAKFYPEGTIVSSGISKWCGAGGWRLGTLTFPQELSWLMDAISVVASETYTSVSAPIQYAAVEAFRKNEEVENYLLHVRRILRTLGNEVADKLREAGIRLYPPEGAFYVFADFSGFADRLRKKGIETSRALAERLLEDAGIAMLPGEDFNRPREELTARIAYVNFDGAQTLSASKTIPLDEDLPPSFTRTWCEDTLTAVERIKEWLAQNS